MKELLKEPNACPGGFTLHAYCKYHNPEHTYKEFPHEFYAQTKKRAKIDGRSYGWIFHRDGLGTCPKCSGKRKSTK